MRLCKFCGKELIREMDGYDDYYFCKCEGQSKLKQLNVEIHKAENNLRDLKNQREQHIVNSEYYKKMTELKGKINILDNTYCNDSYNPAKL
jgi:hypothetical protein